MGLNELNHVCYLNELAHLLLREDHFAAYCNVKDAVISLDKLGLEAQYIFQGGCQPGSPGVVVSRYAVRDRDLHWPAPPV